MTTTNVESVIGDLIAEAFSNKVKNVKAEQVVLLANELNIETITIQSTGKNKKRNKKELLEDINNKIKQISCPELLHLIKKTNIGVELEVKNILHKNIVIDDVISSNLCLPLDKFLEENPCLRELFVNVCDLVNINDAIKSVNCVPVKVQGLYILTISKNNIDYIVKLGSFAESQGMYLRICSFGGGNYETGSLTNKWFQSFIKKAIAEGYTSKFTYYNKIQEKIIIDSLDGKIEMTPYVMRPLETELFKKYNKSNNNIPPIFGSNCL